jgi:hypothetical protein
MVLFLRRDCAGGAGPTVDAPRFTLLVPAVVGGAAVVEVPDVAVAVVVGAAEVVVEVIDAIPVVAEVVAGSCAAELVVIGLPRLANKLPACEVVAGVIVGLLFGAPNPGKSVPADVAVDGAGEEVEVVARLPKKDFCGASAVVIAGNEGLGDGLAGPRDENVNGFCVCWESEAEDGTLNKEPDVWDVPGVPTEPNMLGFDASAFSDDVAPVPEVACFVSDCLSLLVFEKNKPPVDEDCG